MLNSVVQTKIRFFDMNPIGRLMNRFSQDIGNIDDPLPCNLYESIQVLRFCKIYYCCPSLILSC